MNRKLKIWPALTILLLIIVLISIPLYLIGFKLLLAEHPRSSTIAASSLMADKELTDKESQESNGNNDVALPFSSSNFITTLLSALSSNNSLQKIQPRLQRLDCARAMAANQKEDGKENDDGDNEARTAYVNEVLREGRITLDSDPVDEFAVDMRCPAVRQRWHFPVRAASQAEDQFPVAFARTVYRDYLLVEQMLAVEYAPQNIYCYALDSKASPMFKRRIRALAACFPNVFVAKWELDVQSNGKNVSRSHLDCLELLLTNGGVDGAGNGGGGDGDGGIAGGGWKYAILLQNQDIPIRTNAELVEVLEAYNGTNEVGTLRITLGSIDESLDWTLESLGLYRNASAMPAALQKQRLHHSKSLNLVALSREAVNFMVNQLQLDTYIERMERSHYGMDEVFVSTLNSNLPDFPGGFTWKCLEDKSHPGQEPASRYVIWDQPNGGRRCLSRYFRHSVCVMGLEDVHQLARLPLFFYANKMLPEFDYGAIHCWLQLLAARRAEDDLSALASGGLRATAASQRQSTELYANLPQVRYNRLRAAGRLANFKC